MLRVISGTAPQVMTQAQPDPTPASAWIEDQYEELRGQWVAVRLDQPVLVASAPPLSQLWQTAPPALLRDCLIHSVWTVKEENQAQAPWWEGGASQQCWS